MEWISVQDNLPNDERTVVVFCEHGVIAGAYHKDYQRQYWYCIDAAILDPEFEDYELYKVTHWADFPNPPIETQE
jgi:hypothetical protein